MAYVVRKPLNIGGKRREIGEGLQDDEVRSASVIRSGLVVYTSGETASQGDSQGEGYISVPIGVGTDARGLTVSIQGIREAISIAQMASGKATDTVKTLEDIPTLTLVEAIVATKGTKAAAAERIKELTKGAGPEGGE